MSPFRTETRARALPNSSQARTMGDTPTVDDEALAALLGPGLKPARGPAPKLSHIRADILMARDAQLAKAERLAGASLVCHKELTTGLLSWHHMCESSCGSGQARHPWIWLQRRPFQPMRPRQPFQPRLLLFRPHDRHQNHRRQVNPQDLRWMSCRPSVCRRSQPFQPTRCRCRFHCRLHYQCPNCRQAS